MVERTWFNRRHHNAIAKDIREELKMMLDSDYTHTQRLVAGKTLYDLALRFAKRFNDDNPRFDPVKFLNACSPDTDRLPLGELWDA